MYNRKKVNKAKCEIEQIFSGRSVGLVPLQVRMILLLGMYSG